MIGLRSQISERIRMTIAIVNNRYLLLLLLLSWANRLDFGTDRDTVSIPRSVH